MSSLLPLILIPLLATTVYFLHLSRRRRGRALPGPASFLPYIGNALQIPPLHPWLYYTQLKDTYGDVAQLRAFGQNIVILNSFAATKELLVKRASLYSDRPRAVMCGEILGFEKGLALGRYGPTWRGQRKLFQQGLTKVVVREYWDSIEHETKSLVARLQAQPADFVPDLRLTSARLILGITYGLDVTRIDAGFAKLAEEANNVAVKALTPGAFLVDLIPALKYCPEWLAPFKKQARVWRTLIQRMASEPFEKVKSDVAAGSAVPSFTTRLLDADDSLLDEDAKKWLSATMYSAGADTTRAMVTRFILAMVLNPHIQRKAQEEITQVVGSDCIPTMNDKSKLPYIECMLKELYRWHTITPMGIPHALSEDDTFNGYHLPKGSIVIPNSYALSVDPEMYPEPEKFLPERFMPSVSEPNKVQPINPRSFVYGYGRRACPGACLAETVVYSTIVTLLATTDIVMSRDEQGHEIMPQIAFTGTTLNELEPFQCHFKPRKNDLL